MEAESQNVFKTCLKTQMKTWIQACGPELKESEGGQKRPWLKFLCLVKHETMLFTAASQSSNSQGNTENLYGRRNDRSNQQPGCMHTNKARPELLSGPYGNSAEVPQCKGRRGDRTQKAPAKESAGSSLKTQLCHPPDSCVSLGKWFPLSVPHFLQGRKRISPHKLIIRIKYSNARKVWGRVPGTK